MRSLTRFNRSAPASASGWRVSGQARMASRSLSITPPCSPIGRRGSSAALDRPPGYSELLGMLLALLAAAALAQEPPARTLPEGTRAERAAAALHGGVEAKPLVAPAPGSAEAWKAWAADLET